MSKKFWQGVVMAAAFVIPAGSAFAICRDGDVFSCVCPNGTPSVRYCINNFPGPCQCATVLPEVAPEDAQASAQPQASEEAPVCMEASRPAPEPASTRS